MRKPAHILRLPLFHLKIFEKNNLGYNRFGVIVGKAAAKGAVARHRIKRLLLARVEEWPNAGRDFLFTVLPGAQEAKRDGLSSELKNTLPLVKSRLSS